MDRIFRDFVERLFESAQGSDLHQIMADTSAALGLPYFTYLVVPQGRRGAAPFISNYPPEWVARYLHNGYRQLDPVIIWAQGSSEPFEWGVGQPLNQLWQQRQTFFEEAAEFGIRYGLTIPVHDERGATAALTLATDELKRTVHRSIEKDARVLQLMAIHYHANARRRFIRDRIVDGVALSPREFECLAWSSRGKSAWEIGRILGISRRTVAFHLDNVKAKLGVRTIHQAIARLDASELNAD